MSIKIAFFLNEKRISGILTKLFTGCYAYHMAFVDIENGKMYDMNLIRRRRQWPRINRNDQVIMFDCPVPVSVAYLEERLDTDSATYGWKDYLLFAIRPIYHLFGKSTRNAGGVICSEMVNNDLIACGWNSPWPFWAHPPSPCEMLKHFSRE